MTFAIVDDSADDREALKSNCSPTSHKTIFPQITEFEKCRGISSRCQSKDLLCRIFEHLHERKTGMDVAQELFNSGCNSS